MDESWGGWLATTRAKRGGANNPSQVSLKLIQRFRDFVAERVVKKVMAAIQEASVTGTGRVLKKGPMH